MLFIDPLASNKGFWADLLGVGDFYYETGILIVQICLQTRSSNGGLISITTLLTKIKSLKKSKTISTLSVEDIHRSIEKLTVLGSGYKIIQSKGSEGYLLSVPTEFNKDHEDLISLAQSEGHVSYPLMHCHHSWSRERFQIAVDNLLKDGIVWVDIYQGKILCGY